MTASMNRNDGINVSSTDPARCEVCPLNRVQAGAAVRVRRLCAAPEIQYRLRELGICEDQIIRLLTAQTNYICQVCNARFAISEALAKLIMVEPVLAPATVRKDDHRKR